jgi:hypothetical protein
VSVSTAAQTNICLPLILSLVSSIATTLLSLPRDAQDDALQGVHPPIDGDVARPYHPRLVRHRAIREPRQVEQAGNYLLL